MATHARYADIKKWAESTGRRSIQLWMPDDAVCALDRLCRERGVRWAELLDSLISEADRGNRSDEAAEGAKVLDS